MPNFSILLLLNFYLMRIYIINFTPSFKMLRKETFRFSIFFFIKKSSASMSNFINLESLYVNLDYKFQPPSFYILKKGKFRSFDLPFINALNSTTISKIMKIYRTKFTSLIYVLKMRKFRFFDFTLY